MQTDFFSKKNIPNILTLLRVFLTPFIIILLLVNELVKINVYSFTIFASESDWTLNTKVDILFFIAGILFLIACFSDFLDGYLSRKNNWVSDFGKIWDPIADKILTTSIFIVFAFMKIVPIWVVIIMVIRDLIVDGYRIFLSSKEIIIPANVMGKLKTIWQMVGLIVIFFIFNDNNLNSLNYYFLQNISLIFATFLSITSGIVYIYKASIELKKDK